MRKQKAVHFQAGLIKKIFSGEKLLGVADCKITNEDGIFWGDSLVFGQPEPIIMIGDERITKIVKIQR